MYLLWKIEIVSLILIYSSDIYQAVFCGSTVYFVLWVLFIGSDEPLAFHF